MPWCKTQQATKNQFTQFPTHTFLSFVFYPYFSGMPTNPLEKQFALLGTASTAGLLDVQKAYRWLCHIVAYVTVVIAFFLLQAWINDYCLVSGRRFSHWPCLPPDLASWKKSVKLLLRWAGSPNQLYHCQGYCKAKFSSFNRRYTSSNFRDGKNRASEISWAFLYLLKIFNINNFPPSYFSLQKHLTPSSWLKTSNKKRWQPAVKMLRVWQRYKSARSFFLERLALFASQVL